MHLAVLVAAAAVTALPPPAAPDGWTVAREGRTSMCAATGPVDGAAQLSIGAVGPQLLLMVYAPALPPGQGASALTLAIDGAPPQQFGAIDQDSTFGAPISPQLAKALGPATRLRVIAAGHRFSFPVRNVGPVLDAVARCAGGPALAQRDARPAAAIPGAGDWKLEPPVPGGASCAARLTGKEMDLRLGLNPGGILLLTAQRPDWKPWPAGALTRLQLDEASPLTLLASSIGDAVVTMLPDETLVGQLRQARRLSWTMPTGAFHADVTGLGAALDALRACDRRGGR